MSTLSPLQPGGTARTAEGPPGAGTVTDVSAGIPALVADSASSSAREFAADAPGFITPAQWAEFDATGFVNLGRVTPDGLLGRLRARAQELMMGEVRYDNLLMQIDPGGEYVSQPSDRGCCVCRHHRRCCGEQGWDRSPVFSAGLVQVPPEPGGARRCTVSFLCMAWRVSVRLCTPNFLATPPPWHGRKRLGSRRRR